MTNEKAGRFSTVPPFLCPVPLNDLCLSEVNIPERLRHRLSFEAADSFQRQVTAGRSDTECIVSGRNRPSCVGVPGELVRRDREGYVGRLARLQRDALEAFQLYGLERLSGLRRYIQLYDFVSLNAACIGDLAADLDKAVLRLGRRLYVDVAVGERGLGESESERISCAFGLDAVVVAVWLGAFCGRIADAKLS